MAEINRENAKEINFWGTIEETVEHLIECRNKGESVWTEFNGKILYSADVTLEGAYLQITGFTKEEVEKGREEFGEAKTEEETEALEKKYGAIKQEHIDDQKKNAKEINFWGTIEETVEHLRECRNKGESVWTKFNDKILYSADVTLEGAYLQITGFTKEEVEKGREEFGEAKTEEETQALEEKYEAIKQEHIDDQKKNAKEINFWGTIEETVEHLIECRNKGESVWTKFNGKILYSADVTLEGAYLQITGFTKEEVEKGREEFGEAKTKEETEALEKKYEAIKQRHIDEEKIVKEKEEKIKLISEINDIEQQIERLKYKEAELKKLLDGNETQLEKEGK